jgi:hypothetical protein
VYGVGVRYETWAFRLAATAGWVLLIAAAVAGVWPRYHQGYDPPPASHPYATDAAVLAVAGLALLLGVKAARIRSRRRS